MIVDCRWSSRPLLSIQISLLLGILGGWVTLLCGDAERAIESFERMNQAKSP